MDIKFGVGLSEELVIKSCQVIGEKSKLSGETNRERFLNYLRGKREEVYYEQDPGVQRKLSNIAARFRKINRKYNPVKVEKVPGGREYVKKRLVGGVTDLAGLIDGKHANRRQLPKTPTKRKKIKRKSRVVG